MKKIYLLLFWGLFSLTLQAQLTELYIAPSGTGSEDGTSFDDAMDIPGLLSYLSSYGNSYPFPTEITLAFAGGDYYGYNLQIYSNIWLANVTGLHIYGGFDPNLDPAPFDPNNYNDIEEVLEVRDLENNPTILHACNLNSSPLPSNYHPLLWIANGYSPTNTLNIIDGFVFTSDQTWVGSSAMALQASDFLISRCKIIDYYTTDQLIFLEGGENIVTFANCLIADNEADVTFDAYIDAASIINTTIANNNHLLAFIYSDINFNIQNSILWGNSDLYIASGGTNPNSDVSNSIIESQEWWMNDIGGNLWITDPEFIYQTAQPYSCVASTLQMNNIGAVAPSPAINAGDPNALLYLPHGFENHDIINHPRLTAGGLIDIGAYQNITPYGQSYYMPKRPSQTDTSATNESTLIYSITGQKICSLEQHEWRLLPSGMFIITSPDGTHSRKIINP